MDQTARFYLEKMAKQIIDARESFSNKKSSILDFDLDLEKGLQNDPETFEIEIDRVLTCQALESVSGMVKRLIRMSKLTAVRTPSEQTGVYIREAARTYVYGFMQASAAMSRAALEQALKERLSHQGTGVFITLQDLVNDAKKWKIVDGKTARAVRDTAKKADSVLHAEPISEDGAFEVLIEVRGLLQQIYDANEGF